MPQRKSSNILKLSGSFAHNPQRDRSDVVPQCSDPFPEKPPMLLSDAEEKAFLEIKALIPPGVAFSSDVILVELCSVLLVEFRRKRGKSSPAILTRLNACLNALGLTPSGREGLKVAKPKSKDEDFI